MIITKLYGGLGNQMYQYAAGKSLSLNLDTEMYLDNTWFDEIKGNPDIVQRGYELDGFNILPKPLSITDKIRIKTSPPYTLVEQSFDYNNEFEAVSGNIILDGYWQSFKYFDKYRGVILEDFSFPRVMEGPNSEILNQILGSESICIHVRRGDYNTARGKEFHGLIEPEYYYRALKSLIKDTTAPKLFLFSDELDWCKKTFKFDYPTVFIDSNSANTGVQDMQLMSACKHNIIANSSFSWWAAWLNQNKSKQVYAPRNWFTNIESIRDRIPEGWKVL